MWLMDMKYFLSEKSVVNRYIHSIKWSIVSSPEDSEWPTCDSPFIIAQYNAANGTSYAAVPEGVVVAAANLGVADDLWVPVFIYALLS